MDAHACFIRSDCEFFSPVVSLFDGFDYIPIHKIQLHLLPSGDVLRAVSSIVARCNRTRAAAQHSGYEYIERNSVDLKPKCTIYDGCTNEWVSQQTNVLCINKIANIFLTFFSISSVLSSTSFLFVWANYTFSHIAHFGFVREYREWKKTWPK